MLEFGVKGPLKKKLCKVLMNVSVLMLGKLLSFKNRIFPAQ